MLTARLVGLLTILAMLLAPLGMLGGHAAMAATAAAASTADHHILSGEHCAETGDRPENDRSRDGDCLINCAIACSAIPAIGARMASPAILIVPQPRSLVAGVIGLHPEFDPPPPRHS